MGWGLEFLWCCLLLVVVGELVGCLVVCVEILVSDLSLGYDRCLWLRYIDLSLVF